jgi:hypothetical protein
LADNDAALERHKPGEYTIIYDPYLDMDDTFGDIERINMVRRLLPEEKTSEYDDLSALLGHPEGLVHSRRVQAEWKPVCPSC